MEDNNIHIGPSDYIPWLNDNKICFIRMEGRGFGNVPLTLDIKLSVEDAPNSGGVMIDAIRCMKLALDRGIGGVLNSISAFTMKSPPVQYTDTEAKKWWKNSLMVGESGNEGRPVGCRRRKEAAASL